MKAETLMKSADDVTLAANAVQLLNELARRKRNSRLYEVFIFVAQGAKALETLLIPDVRQSALAGA